MVAYFDSTLFTVSCAHTLNTVVTVLSNILLASPRKYLFVIDVILLIVGPVSVLLLLGWVLKLSQEYTGTWILLTTCIIISYTTLDTGILPSQDPTCTRVKKIVITALRWGRFWISPVITVLTQIVLVVGYVKLNPFVRVPHWLSRMIVTNHMLTAGRAFVSYGCCGRLLDAGVPRLRSSVQCPSSVLSVTTIIPETRNYPQTFLLCVDLPRHYYHPCQQARSRRHVLDNGISAYGSQRL